MGVSRLVLPRHIIPEPCYIVATKRVPKSYRGLTHICCRTYFLSKIYLSQHKFIWIKIFYMLFSFLWKLCTKTYALQCVTHLLFTNQTTYRDMLPHMSSYSNYISISCNEPFVVLHLILFFSFTKLIGHAFPFLMVYFLLTFNWPTLVH